MTRFSYHLLLFALVLMTGWTTAHAQVSPGVTPAERIKLTLVDNKSTYTTVNERNNYENLLRLSQPDSENKLSAGMLNDGDNHIVLHRVDDQGVDNTFARINLNAEVNYPDMEYIGIINFYGDGSSAPSSNLTLTNDYLPDNWSTDGSGLVWQTSGYGTITSSSGLTFTVPDGYTNAVIQLIVYVGSNVRGGYFGYNYNSGGWYVTSQVSAGGAYVLRTFTGVNSGDVINIYGGEQSGSSYYLAQSPDIALIAFAAIPSSLIPTATVNPSISYWQGDDWGVETALSGVSTTTYSVNDTINLYDLGTLSDVFYAETDQNNHSAYYNYSTSFDANVILPNNGATGLDFYASADFAAATSTDISTAAYVGPNNWEFLGTNIYTPSAGTCAYIVYYGSILYLMPETFMGNSVTVTITTSTGDDGAGAIYVNNVLHEFTPGETFSWIVPVTANGAIEFKGNALNDFTNNYSSDITRIVISSGDGTASSASVEHGFGNNWQATIGNGGSNSKPMNESKNAQHIRITIND
ncbi:MAG: hypothetical protein IKZ92_00690 [Muribaculaceae bacterium]|nr:hypothetical protein [Muribaculaceae bacterium]